MKRGSGTEQSGGRACPSAPDKAAGQPEEMRGEKIQREDRIEEYCLDRKGWERYYNTEHMFDYFVTCIRCGEARRKTGDRQP